MYTDTADFGIGNIINTVGGDKQAVQKYIENQETEVLILAHKCMTRLRNGRNQIGTRKITRKGNKRLACDSVGLVWCCNLPIFTKIPALGDFTLFMAPPETFVNESL